MNANVFGCYTEHLFATKAMENGLLVSFPLLHTSIYDCIVDSPNGLFKVQIKGINEKNRTRNRIFLTDTKVEFHNKNIADIFIAKDTDIFSLYS